VLDQARFEFEGRQAMIDAGGMVSALGLEPRTFRLKIQKSAISINVLRVSYCIDVAVGPTSKAAVTGGLVAAPGHECRRGRSPAAGAFSTWNAIMRQHQANPSVEKLRRMPAAERGPRFRALIAFYGVRIEGAPQRLRARHLSRIQQAQAVGQQLGITDPVVRKDHIFLVATSGNHSILKKRELLLPKFLHIN
jgi:hypothetical protein